MGSKNRLTHDYIYFFAQGARLYVYGALIPNECRAAVRHSSSVSNEILAEDESQFREGSVSLVKDVTVMKTPDRKSPRVTKSAHDFSALGSMLINQANGH